MKLFPALARLWSSHGGELVLSRCSRDPRTGTAEMVTYHASRLPDEPGYRVRIRVRGRAGERESVEIWSEARLTGLGERARV